MKAARNIHPEAEKPFYVSFSGKEKYLGCPKAYQYAKKEKLESEDRSVNLCIGTAIDDGLSGFIAADALGKAIDPWPLVEATFDEQCANNRVDFGTTWEGPEPVKATMKVLVEKFVERWREMGWKAALDPAGKPLVQVPFKLRLPQNIIVPGVIDVIARTPESKTVLVDIKTAAQASSEVFGLNAGQLTIYQIYAESDARLGLESIDGLAFFELVKRKIPKRQGQGPTVDVPRVMPLRDAERKEDEIQSFLQVAENVRLNRFPRTSGQSYNSPCNMCEFARLCTTGDRTGLHARELRIVQ